MRNPEKDPPMTAPVSVTSPPVLLVDDRQDNLLALTTLLEPLEVKLDTASSGAAALRLLLDKDYAAILLDVQMPDLDGFETARLIRERERSRLTPIVFLTAIHQTDEHAARGYDLGAVDYIFKPVVADVLLAKVRVFSDLFEKSELLTRQAALMQDELKQLRGLSAEQGQHREEASLEPARAHYTEQLRAFLREPERVQPTETIARNLFECRVSGKQLVEIHLDAIDRLTPQLDGLSAGPTVAQSRLLILGVLANLTDLYRQQSVPQQPMDNASKKEEAGS